MKPIFDNCQDKIGILNRKIDLVENKNSIKKTEANLINSQNGITCDHEINTSNARSNSRSKLSNYQSSPNVKAKTNLQPK